MEPVRYQVVKINGDYAILQNRDKPEEEPIQIALALMPDETADGMFIKLENFVFSIDD